jgi:hypothetical protein
MYPETAAVSYKDAIPDDIQDELIAIRDRLTESAFKVGDIALQVISARKDLSKDFIYSAVGSFCGRSARTVRYYAMVAEFYTPEVRGWYPTLSFDHFRFAMKYAEWNEILIYASVDPDTGRPVTIDKLEAQFGYLDEKKDIDPGEFSGKLRDLKGMIYKLDIPIEIMLRIKSALSVIEEELRKLN